MAPKLLQKTSIFLLIIVVIFMIYLGAYLPFKKSKNFISSMRSLRNVRSVDEIEFIFNKVLDSPSPVSKEETMGFFVDQMVSLLNTKPPQPVGEALINYVEEKTQKSLNDYRNPELTKLFLKMAILYQTSWRLYGKEEHFSRAEEFYKKCLEVSPRRIQALYGIFDIYLAHGDKEKLRKIGEEILRYWPSDTRISQILNSV